MKAGEKRRKRGWNEIRGQDRKRCREPSTHHLNGQNPLWMNKNISEQVEKKEKKGLQNQIYCQLSFENRCPPKYGRAQM